MWAMFFQDAKRQQAGGFGELDGIAKVGGSQFFPLHGKFGLCLRGINTEESDERKTESCSLHERSSRTAMHFSPVPCPRDAAFLVRCRSEGRQQPGRGEYRSSV